MSLSGDVSYQLLRRIFFLQFRFLNSIFLCVFSFACFAYKVYHTFPQIKVPHQFKRHHTQYKNATEKSWLWQHIVLCSPIHWNPLNSWKRVIFDWISKCLNRHFLCFGYYDSMSVAEKFNIRYGFHRHWKPWQQGVFNFCKKIREKYETKQLLYVSSSKAKFWPFCV